MAKATAPVTFKTRLKLLGKRLGLAFGALLMLAVILEIAVRVFSDIQPSIKDVHPVSGQRYRPHFDGEIFVDEVATNVHIRINSDGFRGAERPRARPKGVRRIALLGDSFIAAISTEETKTTAVQLERMLNAKGGSPKWEVMNFGVSGAGTGTEMVTYQEVARHYEPDIVICAFYTGNDLADNSRQLSWASNRIYFELDADGQPVQLPFFGTRRRVSGWLNRYSRFYIWQKHVFDKARHAYGGVSAGSWAFSADPPKHVVESWDLTEKLMLAFRDRVEEHGRKFAMVGIPCSRQIYDDLWSEFSGEVPEERRPLGRAYPEAQLARMCSSGKVSLLLLRDPFLEAAPARSSKQKDEWLFNMGHAHLTPAGNRLAAEQIHRFLVREGFGVPAVDEAQHGRNSPGSRPPGAAADASAQQSKMP